MRSAIRASNWGAASIVVVVLLDGTAHAEGGLPPLPPPSVEPPLSPSPAAPAPSSPLPPQSPSSPPASSVPIPAPPAEYGDEAPLRGPAAHADKDQRAPRYSLWLGGGLGLLVYSGGLYINDPNPPPGNSGIETTGNFVRPGMALQVDVGARIAWRFIPYLALEFGLVGAGRRFEGTSTSASTSFLGVGFRYLAGDIDWVSFAGDISIGLRRLQVTNSSGTWSASGLELFRLGFGADMRVSPRVTVSPMFTLSGGELTDTSGNISFAANQPDRQTGPLFVGSGGIPAGAQQTYFAVVLGCGAHVDLFGK
jgi:hypothetical protein